MSVKAKLTTCYVCNCVDLLLTLYWVNVIGLAAEWNPLGRMILATPAVAVCVKIIGVGAALYLIYRVRELPIALLGANVVFIAYLVLTLYHTTLLAMYFA